MATDGDKNSFAEACEGFLSAPISSLESSRSLKLASKVRELGRGEHATASLWKTSSGEEVVSKTFFPDSVDQIENDWVAYLYLEAHRAQFPFKVARALKKNSGGIVMEYADGINLEKIMSSESFDQRFKDKLKMAYIQKVGEVYTFFDDRCFQVQYRNQNSGFGKAILVIKPQVKATCEKGELFLEYIIKSDNVIVDLNTLEMTLIDPY